jgi:hypothetical protein
MSWITNCKRWLCKVGLHAWEIDIGMSPNRYRPDFLWIRTRRCLRCEEIQVRYSGASTSSDWMVKTPGR